MSFQCKTCGYKTTVDGVIVCEHCVSIPIGRCFECQVVFQPDQGVRRCWVAQCRGRGDEEQMYATTRSMWSASDRQKWDPTKWHSTVPWGFTTTKWSEEARSLPFCIRCAFRKRLPRPIPGVPTKSLCFWDSKSKVSFPWDLTFDGFEWTSEEILDWDMRNRSDPDPLV